MHGVSATRVDQKRRLGARMKRMQTAQWWRVVVDASGLATSCNAVDAAGSDDGGGVFYVQAVSPIQAGREAAAQYAKAVRHKHKTLGLATTSGQRAPRAKALPPSPPRLVLPVTGLREASSQPPSLPPAKINTRLAVLAEVQEAWLQHSTIGQFTKWLNAEIEALRDKASRSA